MKKCILRILILVFTAVFLVSGCMIVKEILVRRKAVSYLSNISAKYSPVYSDTFSGSKQESTDVEENTDTGNPSIQALVDEYPDAVGWLSVLGAEVDHPFVIGEDNAEYIRAGLDGEYLISGTLFMDYRNTRDLDDGLSVIYGHNMKDKTMFAKLSNYGDAQYIAENPDVYVYLPEETRHYTVYAYMIEDAATSVLYENFGRRDNIQDIADYITANADYVNPEVTINGESKILALSTCNPVYFTARAVLICVLD